MRGTWVGALCSWCHCPLESGGTLPLQRDATQPPRLTPRIAGVATAHPMLPDNSRENSTEKREKREEKEGVYYRKTSPTPLPREQERDARGLENIVRARLGYEALWPAGTLAFGQWHRFVSALHRFSELLVATCCVQTLERPGKHNSSRHATSPVTTEIIAHAGRATLSPAPANCVLLLLSLALLPIRSCPSARMTPFVFLAPGWRFSLPVPSPKTDTQKRGHQLENDPSKMPILLSRSIIWNTLA